MAPLSRGAGTKCLRGAIFGNAENSKFAVRQTSSLDNLSQMRYNSLEIISPIERAD